MAFNLRWYCMITILQCTELIILIISIVLNIYGYFDASLSICLVNMRYLVVLSDLANVSCLSTFRFCTSDTSMRPIIGISIITNTMLIGFSVWLVVLYSGVIFNSNNMIFHGLYWLLFALMNFVKPVSLIISYFVYKKYYSNIMDDL